MVGSERCAGLQRRRNRLQGWKKKDRKPTLVFYSDFSFCKIGNWVRCIPPGGRWGAGGGGRRSPCMPSMGPQSHGWDPDIATGCPRRLEKPIRGYLAPAMLRQRMGGAGIRLHSTLLKRSPMTERLAA